MEEILIQSGNALIADFIGLKKRLTEHDVFYTDNNNPYKYHSIHLKYDSSWDWLMPVIEKIANLEITPPPNYSNYRVEIVPSGYIEIRGFPMKKVFRNVSIEGSVIKATWLAVIDFINNYNLTKKEIENI